MKQIFDNEEKANDSIAAYQLTVYRVVYWLRQQPYGNKFIYVFLSMLSYNTDHKQFKRVILAVPTLLVFALQPSSILL